MKNILLLTIFLFSLFIVKAQTPATADTSAKADSNKRFMPVDVMPEYPGGLDKMSTYLKKILNIPKPQEKQTSKDG